MNKESFDEKRKMDEVLDEASSILFAKEVEDRVKKDVPDMLAQEELGQKSKEILENEVPMGVSFVKERLDNFLSDESRVEDVVKWCAKNFERDGWNLETSRKRMDFLLKILPIFYQRLSFINPNEETPQSGSIETVLLADRSGKRTPKRSVYWALYDFVEEEYGGGVVDWIEPLIHVFLTNEMYYFKEKNKSQ